MQRKRQRILSLEARKALQVDAAMQGGLKRNIEEEKILENVNRLSQKLFSSFQATPKPPPSPKIEDSKAEKNEMNDVF